MNAYSIDKIYNIEIAHLSMQSNLFM